jgi:hypothetical protein
MLAAPAALCPPTVLALTLFTAGFVSPVAALAGASRGIATKSIPIQGAERVVIDFSVGELEIVAIDGQQIHLSIEARCKKDRDCDELSEAVRVITQTRDDEVEIEVDDHNWHKDYHLRGRIEVPRSLAVEVRMKVGELDIEGIEKDLDVDLGVGEVDIELPEAAVRSVDLRVSIGEASLRPRSNGSSVRGWLGKQVEWQDGKGRSRVDIDLSVGDARVRLL